MKPAATPPVMPEQIYLLSMALLSLLVLFGMRWWTVRVLDGHISVIRKEQEMHEREEERRLSHLLGRVEVIE